MKYRRKSDGVIVDAELVKGMIWNYYWVTENTPNMVCKYDIARAIFERDYEPVTIREMPKYEVHDPLFAPRPEPMFEMPKEEKPMHSFKVGDRVKIYTERTCMKSTVLEVMHKVIRVSSQEPYIYYHYKQCRRLKLKKEWLKGHPLLGKRVKVYSNFVFTGTVNTVYSTKRGLYLGVTEDGFYSAHNDSPFHVKQCEIEKEPRRIWVCTSEVDKILNDEKLGNQSAFLSSTSISGFERKGCTEFVEVVK